MRAPGWLERFAIAALTLGLATTALVVWLFAHLAQIQAADEDQTCPGYDHSTTWHLAHPGHLLCEDWWEVRLR